MILKLFLQAQLDEATIKQTLKDRQTGGEFINDVDQGIFFLLFISFRNLKDSFDLRVTKDTLFLAMTRLEDFIKAIEREIAKRRNVIELLQNAVKYYDNLGDEVNIVANVKIYLYSE